MILGEIFCIFPYQFLKGGTEDEPEEDALGEHEPEAHQDQDEREEPIDVAGVGGGRGQVSLDHLGYDLTG